MESQTTAIDPPGAGQQQAPENIIRSRPYRMILVLSAGIGLLVSFASWCFLELVHLTQVVAFEWLPETLGFTTMPWWWPLPVLLLAGILIAFAVAKLPGHGGHAPAKGLEVGPPTQPNELPGVLLAALASIGLGLVLGPEAPLIALATGLTMLAVRQARRDVPNETTTVLAAAASFAALSTIFGSPIIGAVIIVEAAGLGGAMMRLVLLPGLLAAGIGSLVFIGMGSLTGLSSEAYAISPLSLPPYPEPSLAAFGWSIVLAMGAAAVTFAVIELGKATHHYVTRRPLVIIPAVSVLIAVLAMVFGELTGQPATLVLLSGQEAMNGIVDQSASMTLLVLVLLFVFKALAWGLSLGGGRGGPTFPALFLGIVAGLVAGNLPGFAETPAVAALMGAMCVSILRLPLASVVVALLVSQAGLATAPLVIVAVVVALITTELLVVSFEPVAAASQSAPPAPSSGESPAPP